MITVTVTQETKVGISQHYSKLISTMWFCNTVNIVVEQTQTLCARIDTQLLVWLSYTQESHLGSFE